MPQAALHEQTNIEFDQPKAARSLRKVKPSSTPSHDGIPPTRIHGGCNDIVALPVNLFTVSIASAVFPSHWKASVISLLHEEGFRMIFLITAT